MAEHSTELNDLIADARLVLSYAARSGRLPPSKSLAEATASATASADHKSTEDHIAALTSALNESIRAIAPITLNDLGSKWQPFPRSKGSHFFRIAVSFFAVGLVVATAYYTQLYSQANSILSVLRDIQSQNVTGKAERLWRFTAKNYQEIFSPTLKKGQDDITFEPYLKNYEDLIRIHDQVITYVPLSIQFTTMAEDPVLKMFAKIASWFSGSKGMLPEEYEAHYKTLPSGGALISPADEVKEAPAEPIRLLKSKQNELANFLFVLGIGALSSTSSNAKGNLEGSSVGTISSLLYECQKWTALLGIWLLPALYGMLGAVVYQMRAILNPLIPDPSFERLLIRFCLGALAGVSISWLFGATPAKLFEAQSLNATLFGVAFVFGFSVDVFFALLDRTVEILSISIAKMGKMDK